MDLDGLIKGPFPMPGIRVNRRGNNYRKEWSQPGLIADLPESEGIYFICPKNESISGRPPVRPEIVLRRDVIFNNTEFMRSALRKGLVSEDLKALVPELEMGGNRLTFVNYREAGNEKYLDLHRLCDVQTDEKEIILVRPFCIDDEFADLSKKDLASPSRIIKIGKGDRGGIQNRIDQYREGTQAAITRKVFGYGAGIFKEVELYCFETEEFNRRTNPCLGRDLTTHEIETDFILQFKKVHGFPPPWEQQGRYSKLRAIPRDAVKYCDFLKSVLDRIETPNLD